MRQWMIALLETGAQMLKAEAGAHIAPQAPRSNLTRAATATSTVATGIHSAGAATTGIGEPLGIAARESTLQIERSPFAFSNEAHSF